MNGRTFVGEYVGNLENQHLVRYDAERIIFYAIVENEDDEDGSADTCIPPHLSARVFDQLHLERVSTVSLGEFTHFRALSNSLQRAFADVAAGRITEEEEGAVLYLVAKSRQGADEGARVLSLCKLKTLEYRLFRKMREKLRNHFRSVEQGLRSDLAYKLSQFQQEMRELRGGLRLPQPEGRYFAFAGFVFEQLSRGDSLLVDLLHNRYIDFLEHMMREHGALRVSFHSESTRGNCKIGSPQSTERGDLSSLVFSHEELKKEEDIDRPLSPPTLQSNEQQAPMEQPLFVLVTPPMLLGANAVALLTERFAYAAQPELSSALEQVRFDARDSRRARLLHVYRTPEQSRIAGGGVVVVAAGLCEEGMAISERNL